MRSDRRIAWRWGIVISLALLAALLGFLGFQKHFSALGETHSNWLVLYLTLQLFTLESGAIEGAVGPELHVARLLAPLVAGYTLVRALLSVASVQARRLWVWLWGKHVIVCGLGRKGANLVEQLRAKAERVVVIESDQNNDDLIRCRELGAVVLIGSANEEWSLKKAFVDRAATLISVTADDGTNVETAVRAHNLNDQGIRTPLRCVIHVAEPNLRRIFEEHRIYKEEHDPFELEFFNAYEVAARVMLREPPVQPVAGEVGGEPPHVLIVGLGRLGETLLWRAARDWDIDRGESETKLRVTVVDVEEAALQRRLHVRRPSLEEMADVRFVSLDVHSPRFADGSFLRGNDDWGKVTAAYVCLDDNALGIYAALALRRCWGDAGAPIVVRMSEEAGMATLLKTRNQPGVIRGVRAVGFLDIACTLEIVLGGTQEILAHAIHQGYVAKQMADGNYSSDDPSMVPWDELNDDLKESNRQQAAHIGEKLMAVGCELVPRLDEPIALIEFTRDEIELMAEMEHDRWVEERLAADWSYGEPKSVEKRISPYLVPWNLPPGDPRKPLTEEVKDYDRNAVRLLPVILAKADYEIRRREQA